MKRFTTVILLVVLAMFALSAQAFAEIFIPPAPVEVATKADVENSTAANKKETDWLSVRETKTRAILLGGEDAFGKKYDGEIPKLSKKIDALTDENGVLMTKLKDTNNNVVNAYSNLQKQIGSSKWAFGTTAIVVLLTASLLAILIFVRTGNTGGRTLSRIGNGIDEVRNQLNVIEEKLDKLPDDTAIAVHAIDPKPLEDDVIGHRFSLTTSPEGIAGGYYQTFQVEEMPDGDKNPATFVRQAITKRGIALKYVRGSIKKYLEGGIKDTPEETLIGYLRSTGELKISKII